MQKSPSSVIIIVLSLHICWLHVGITVLVHNHHFIRSPNSKVGSFEIAKIKIAKIISHTFTFKSRKFSSAKISRYTVLSQSLYWKLINPCQHSCMGCILVSPYLSVCPQRFPHKNCRLQWYFTHMLSMTWGGLLLYLLLTKLLGRWRV